MIQNKQVLNEKEPLSQAEGSLQTQAMTTFMARVCKLKEEQHH